MTDEKKDRDDRPVIGHVHSVVGKLDEDDRPLRRKPLTFIDEPYAGESPSPDLVAPLKGYEPPAEAVKLGPGVVPMADFGNSETHPEKARPASFEDGLEIVTYSQDPLNKSRAIFAVLAMLRAPLECDLSMHRGDWWIYRLEDGRIAVSRFDYSGRQHEEELFDDATRAAKRFYELSSAPSKKETKSGRFDALFHWRHRDQRHHKSLSLEKKARELVDSLSCEALRYDVPEELYKLLAAFRHLRQDARVAQAMNWFKDRDKAL